MTRKLGKICLGVAASAVLLSINPSAYAQDKGYLNCGSGGAVRDPFGNCIVSAGGAAIPECLGEKPVMIKEDGSIKISLAADANFDFNRAQLKAAGKAKLEKLNQDMKQVDVHGVDIVGHTDSIGSESYNLGLSQRRAQSAADYLIALGTNPSIVTTRGAGEANPIAPNTNPNGSDNPEGRAKNRRVDITVDATKMK